MEAINRLLVLLRREFISYFSNQLILALLILYITLSVAANFFIGNFFARGQTDLIAFFRVQPYLYTLFIPLLTTHMWTEESQNNPVSLLCTLPITNQEIVLAKFFAAWLFMNFALLLTCPVWLMLNYLGNPDNSAILANYLYCMMLSGSLIAIGLCISAVAKGKSLAFLLSLVAFSLLNLGDVNVSSNNFITWLPSMFIQFFSIFSMSRSLDFTTSGLVKITNIIYLLSIIGFFLTVTVQVIAKKRLVISE